MIAKLKIMILRRTQLFFYLNFHVELNSIRKIMNSSKILANIVIIPMTSYLFLTHLS
jgi:hypothetical protein